MSRRHRGPVGRWPGPRPHRGVGRRRPRAPRPAGSGSRSPSRGRVPRRDPSRPSRSPAARRPPDPPAASPGGRAPGADGSIPRARHGCPASGCRSRWPAPGHRPDAPARRADAPGPPGRSASGTAGPAPAGRWTGWPASRPRCATHRRAGWAGPRPASAGPRRVPRPPGDRICPGRSSHAAMAPVVCASATARSVSVVAPLDGPPTKRDGPLARQAADEPIERPEAGGGVRGIPVRYRACPAARSSVSAAAPARARPCSPRHPGQPQGAVRPMASDHAEPLAHDARAPPFPEGRQGARHIRQWPDHGTQYRTDVLLDGRAHSPAAQPWLTSVLGRHSRIVCTGDQSPATPGHGSGLVHTVRAGMI